MWVLKIQNSRTRAKKYKLEGNKDIFDDTKEESVNQHENKNEENKNSIERRVTHSMKKINVKKGTINQCD